MSCFIVSKKTMAKAVLSCWMKTGCAHSYEDLWTHFYRLNYEAYQARYPSTERKHPDEIAADHPVWYIGRRTEAPERLKAVQCVLYQCDEGDNLPSSGWRCYLEAAKAALIHEVLNLLPAYVAAPWNEDD